MSSAGMGISSRARPTAWSAAPFPWMSVLLAPMTCLIFLLNERSQPAAAVALKIALIYTSILIC